MGSPGDRVSLQSFSFRVCLGPACPGLGWPSYSGGGGVTRVSLPSHSHLHCQWPATLLETVLANWLTCPRGVTSYTRPPLDVSVCDVSACGVRGCCKPQRNHERDGARSCIRCFTTSGKSNTNSKGGGAILLPRDVAVSDRRHGVSAALTSRAWRPATPASTTTKQGTVVTRLSELSLTQQWWRWWWRWWWTASLT